MHRRRRRLDAVQPTSAEYRVSVVYVGRRQHQLPTDALVVGTDLLSPVSFMRDLGMYVDADLSVRTNVLKAAGICFAAVRPMSHHSVRALVARGVACPVAARLRMCYTCGSAETPESAQNATTRLIFNAS